MFSQRSRKKLRATFPAGILGHVPRKNPLPLRERQIGARLREMRLLQRMARSEFGLGIDVDGSAFARIELGFAPLKYGLADDLLRCFSTKTSPIWLWTGERPMITGTKIVLPPPEWLGFTRWHRFSEVMDSATGQLESIIKRPEEWTLPEPWLRAQQEWARQKLEEMESKVTHCHLYISLLEAKIHNRYVLPQVYDDMAAPRIVVDSLETSLKMASTMKKPPHNEPLQNMAQLRGLLKRATGRRGKKAELARFLDVKMPSVSRWISGARNPDVDMALKMTRWLESQVKKQGKR